MRCKKAIKQIGPYIDGELTAAEAETIRAHLESSDACARRYALTRSLIREVASLPAIVPTPEESYRLMNRVRREMSAEPAPGPRFKRVQLAAAALSVLVAATVVGVAVSVWSGGETTQEAEIAATDERSTGIAEGLGEESPQQPKSVPGGFAVATAAVSPSLAVSGEEYDPGELDGFRNDLGARLDFYSAYWYPSDGSTIAPDTITELQGKLVDDLSRQAEAAGQDAGELRQAVASALQQAGDQLLLPCYAEYATVNGQEAWLVSLSGPEDYLLFPDAQRPPAMMFASLGGEENLKISESLLRELAAWLAPNTSLSFNTITPAGTNRWQPEATVENGDGPSETEADVLTDSTDSLEGGTELGQDFQSFLRRLAARGTSMDTIAALKGLNYEQILELLNGDWAALAADGVNLSDFLTPPKRLWAVDCTTNEVVWEAR